MVTTTKIKRITARLTVDTEDQLAVEEPLEIQLRYNVQGLPEQKSISVTMRTPGNDGELALGFLFTENIIQHNNQVKGVQPGFSGDNSILVTLQDEAKPLLPKADRNFYTTSSCGVCGKSSIDAIKTVSIFAGERDNISLDTGSFYGLQDILRKQQVLFESTGGLHASALFDLEGNFIMLREDVGRHNALDKVIGAAFIENRLPLKNTILLLSGRASFELIQKASMAGIKVIAAVGAPSSLAVSLAQESNLTLIGFLKNERFNIYAGFHRVNDNNADQ